MVDTGGLSTGASAEIVTEAMMNSTKCPPLVLKISMAGLVSTK